MGPISNRGGPACALLIALVSSFRVAVTGQDATPAEAQRRPTFRTGANLVRVDVTVIDRRGRPDSNTVIYTLDPRGFTGRVSDVLQALALGTGGKVFQSNAPATALGQMVRDASAFYLLGYASTENPADGKFHRIKVNVKRSGVDMRARSGYVAPTLAEIASARQKAVRAEVPHDVAQALSVLTRRPESSGDWWVGTTRGADGEPRVTVSWAPREGATQAEITATGENGETYFDGLLTGDTATFAASPGPLKIRRTVLDSDGGPGERDQITVSVPDFDKKSLSLGTPVLLRARSGMEARRLRIDRSPRPYAGHDFGRTDRLLVRFTVFGPAAPEATIVAQLVDRQGDPLTVLSCQALQEQPASYVIEIPIGSVGRGEYLIAIEASHRGDRTRALVPFRAN